MPPYKPLIERFVEHIELDRETGCWNWTGSKNDRGYSVFKFDEKMRSGHQAAFVLFIGELVDGMEIHHECRNRSCCNPNHLRQITHRENTDFDRKKTHCERGHPYVDGSYRVHKTKYGFGRWCKECDRIRNAKHKGIPIEMVGTRENPRPRTHCPKGHSYAEVGFTQKNKGRRVCNACFVERMKRSAAHKREVYAAKKLAAQTKGATA